MDFLLMRIAAANACAPPVMSTSIRGWFNKLEPAEEQEADMLGVVDDPSPTSRLSCRIRMTEKLDGLVLRLPPTHR